MAPRPCVGRRSCVRGEGTAGAYCFFFFFFFFFFKKKMSRDFERSASQAVKSGSSRRGKSRRNSPLPTFIGPQLSQPVEKPPSGPRWLHEIKLRRLSHGRAHRQQPRPTPDSDRPRLDRKISKRHRNARETERQNRLPRWGTLGVDDAGLPTSPTPRRRRTANAMCSSSITLSISCISTVGTSRGFSSQAARVGAPNSDRGRAVSETSGQGFG